MSHSAIVIGADIRTPQDQELGEIEDVVLDPARQTIAYVLASRGGFLGLGGELVPFAGPIFAPRQTMRSMCSMRPLKRSQQRRRSNGGASIRRRATTGAAIWINTGLASLGSGKATPLWDRRRPPRQGDLAL